jgi:catechol 2,3-dioxygenase-like lactoylglutathione lyase family enzyme
MSARWQLIRLFPELYLQSHSSEKQVKGVTASGGQEMRGKTMDMKLEVVILPVSDIDRAKAFYVNQLGFHLDHDAEPGNGMRVVQLTPPGSGCSVVIGRGVSEEMVPGSIKGLHLVVRDVMAVCAMLNSRGVATGDLVEYPGIKYSGFSDPDGNSRVLQEIAPDAKLELPE